MRPARERTPIVLGEDLPTSLIPPMRRVIWAKKLVKKHLGVDAVSSDKPPRQGLFSSTLFVRLEDKRNVVVQFRTEPLDVNSYMLARETLADTVPDIMELSDDELLEEGVWAYCYKRLSGKTLAYNAGAKTALGRIALNTSLGGIFSRGYIAENSVDAIEDTVRPHIKAVLASAHPEVEPHRVLLEQFLSVLHSLQALPLWVAHRDLNEMNILTDDDCYVTGLFGWNHSSPLPLGMGFARIHELAAGPFGGEGREFENAERAFWREILAGMSPRVRENLDTMRLELQDAVTLGTLLDCFPLNGGQVVVDALRLKALPRTLKYRIPMLRGDMPPYDDVLTD